MVRRSRDMWIIDFGLAMSEQQAALYEAPFEYIQSVVRPYRVTVKQQCCRDRWWIHHSRRPEMIAALAGLKRYIATPTVSKHRLFVWLAADVLPDHGLIVFARDDDYTMGDSPFARPRALGARHGTSCRSIGLSLHAHNLLRDIPVPADPTPEQRARVGEAARRLVELRDGWLDPPGVDPADLASGPSPSSTTRALPGSPTLTPSSTPQSSPRTAGSLMTRTVMFCRACSNSI